MKESPDPVAEVRKLLRRATNVISHYAETDRHEDFAVEAAYRLVKAYVMGHKVAAKSTHYKAWLVATRGSGFFNGGLFRVFKKATEYRNQLEAGSSVSELYAVALSIIRDYETYCSERAERKAIIDAHIREQRKIIDSRREEFLRALEIQDGFACRACSSVENLVIDHIEPLINGGFSVLDNLQLLCKFCNASKGVRDMDYLEFMNKRRSIAIK